MRIIFVKALAIAAVGLLSAASLGLASGPRPSTGVSIDLPRGLFDPALEPWRAKPRTRVALDFTANDQLATLFWSRRNS